MKDFLKVNYKYIIVIFIISLVMTFFMTKKEGFHEDEMFSYGSSNYAYDNVQRPYGKEDETNIFVKEKIMNGNIFQNLMKLNLKTKKDCRIGNLFFIDLH